MTLLPKFTLYLKLLPVVVGEFFWGEAVYNLSAGLHRLRKWRVLLATIPIACFALVALSLVEWPHSAMATSEKEWHDSYTIYEGKRLEEKVDRLEKVISNQENLMNEQAKETSARTLVLIRLEDHVKTIDDKLDVGIKVLGAAILLFAGQFASYIFQLRLRKELGRMDHRRYADAIDHADREDS